LNAEPFADKVAGLGMVAERLRKGGQLSTRFDSTIPCRYDHIGLAKQTNSLN
jgi:hypothetical protein